MESSEEYFTPDEMTKNELIKQLDMYKKKYYKYKKKYIRFKRNYDTYSNDSF